MKIIFLNGVKFEFKLMKELRKEAKKYKIEFGINLRIGNHSSIGYGSKILAEASISTHFHFAGYYKYIASGYIDQKTKRVVIQLGCYVRFVEEWDMDFDNNQSEFPIGSDVLKKRRKIFEAIKSILSQAIKLTELTP